MYGYYEVESVLGRGAMGMVYLARDRRIGRRVALKTVHVDEKFDDESEANEFYSRLQREAELCGSLQHPNIVTLYEPGYENDTIAWMATEYVDGESLRDRLRKRKPLPLDEALRIGEDILRGLAFAHTKGIVHRDVKPANILLTSAGDAKIADFGIARPVDSNLTAVGEMLGTPSYMSPEQVKCTAVTARSDLFSAGAVIYEMITGIKAFGAADVQSILRNVVEVTPRAASDINADIPAPLSELLSKMMSKSPEDRVASASIAADEIREIRKQFVTPTEALVEELAAPVDEEGVSTLAARAPSLDSGSHPSSTAVTGGKDLTPSFGRLTRHPLLRRRISPAVFFSAVLLLLASLSGAAYSIKSRTNSAPTFTYSPAQLREFEQKRESLAAARVLFMAGEYEQSVKAYDAFLERYPNTPSALEGRDEASKALELSKAKTRVNVVARKPSATKKPAAADTPPPEPEKKKGIWRRIFGRN